MMLFALQRFRCGADSSRRPGRSRGFTLIELLVVVSIIALLVSILLPALSRARQQARVVMCASNIRNINLGMVFFAEQNDDRMPDNMNHFGYMNHGVFFWGTWRNLGELWRDRLIDNPEVFYCPGFTRPVPGMPEFQLYDSVKDLWLNPNPNLMNNRQLHITYQYLIGHMPDNPMAPSYGGKGSWEVPGWKALPDAPTGDNGWPRGVGAKLSQIGNLPFIADVVHGHGVWMHRHHGRAAVNVSYGDGHVEIQQLGPHVVDDPSYWSGYWQWGTPSLHLLFYEFIN